MILVLHTIFNLQQDKSTQEDIKDKSITEVANESKATEDSPSVQKDEKKEKVKKKRSFRSFSFLRREKKAKEENKNGEAAKEVSGICQLQILN